jgi:hypothetical protein
MQPAADAAAPHHPPNLLQRFVAFVDAQFVLVSNIVSPCLPPRFALAFIP